MQFSGVGITDRAFSGVRELNFTKLGQNIGRSSQHCSFVPEFGYLAAFLSAGGSKLSDVLNHAKFRTFWPPVKIKEVPISVNGNLDVLGGGVVTQHTAIYFSDFIAQNMTKPNKLCSMGKCSDRQHRQMVYRGI